MIKAGLILSLFGGNAKRAQSRSDIHVLLLGDPGLGKSNMLQACARISTKGIHEKANNFFIFFANINICTYTYYIFSSFYMKKIFKKLYDKRVLC